MNDHPDDRDPHLSEMMSDAVSDIEPRNALDTIRNRAKVTPMSPRSRSRKPWLYAVTGAVVATAAVVTAIAFAGDQLGLGNDDPGPAASSTAAGEPTRSAQSPTPSQPAATSSTEPPTGQITVPAYFLGDTPQGPRLFREFDKVTAADPLAGALAQLQGKPADLDYRTPWPADAFSGASFDGVGADGIVTVSLTDGSLHDRPAGMSRDEAEVAVQQVVYTMQAAVQARAAVAFELDGNPIDQVLGVPTSEPLANAPQLDVLAMVNVTTPEEGAVVSGSFAASGVASSFEANVPWEIRQGDRVVKTGFVMAEGWMDKLYPWQTTVDVSDLAPGQYTFVAMTDDPSGGEGGGPTEDSRTITVR